MKKQELIHLHGLLAEVGDFYEAQTGMKLDLEAYEGQSVRPTSIHRSKTDHKDAVFALAQGITKEMTEERDPVPARAD